MNLLQRHAALRRAFVVAEQLVCAAVIYTVAALTWKALGGGRGRPGLVTVLVATTVVAAVLARLRPRFERVVNWLAFGERADGYELASGLLKRLATSLEVDEVLPRLAETVARSVGSRRGEVHVWMADGNTWRQTWPVDAADGAAEVTVPVHHGGDPVGEMVVGLAEAELSPGDRRLLRQLAGPAGLALSTVRLTQALRQQASEIEATTVLIEASRQRIVSARRSEQERIRRQLATLVQPHLDASGQVLRGPGPLDESCLEGARTEVAHALEELRGLARGLFPAGLGETGLCDTLRGWAESNGKLVSLSASGDLDRLYHQEEVAAALYFCAVTALTGPATVSVNVADADAVLEVRGQLDLTDLQGLSDRAEAFGGDVQVEAEGEPVLRVRLPLVAEPAR